MSIKNLEGIKMPSGSAQVASWDTDSKKVTVGGGYAGTASNEKEAWAVASYYATTTIKDYKPIGL
jgi:hypothetical protein